MSMFHCPCFQCQQVRNAAHSQQIQSQLGGILGGIGSLAGEYLKRQEQEAAKAKVSELKEALRRIRRLAADDYVPLATIRVIRKVVSEIELD